MQDRNQKPEQQPADVDFHGAAIIDEKGKEIPITEEMIQQACEKLEDEKSDNSSD